MCGHYAVLTQSALSITFKILFNITLSSTPRPTKCSLSFRFPSQNSLCISLLPVTAPHSTHLIPLHLITQTLFGKEGVLKLQSLKYSAVSSY